MRNKLDYLVFVQKWSINLKIIPTPRGELLIRFSRTSTR